MKSSTKKVLAASVFLIVGALMDPKVVPFYFMVVAAMLAVEHIKETLK